MCDWEGGGIIRGRLCMLRRVEESSGVSACDREGGGIIRGCLRVIGCVEESSDGRL